MKKIILLGYMGCGKTETAAALASLTGLVAIDMDQVIEADQQMTIAQIFKIRGELAFRRREHELFVQMMQNDESFILSLGGGTPCYAGNHQWLNIENTVSFYLRTPLEELYQRLLSQRNHRPLIAAMDESEMKEFIAKSLFERSFYYNQATHTVDTGSKSVGQVATEINQFLV